MRRVELEGGGPGASRLLCREADLHAAPAMPRCAGPEVLLGEKVTEKSDIYSAGVVLWEVVTGEWSHFNFLVGMKYNDLRGCGRGHRTGRPVLLSRALNVAAPGVGFDVCYLAALHSPHLPTHPAHTHRHTRARLHTHTHKHCEPVPPAPAGEVPQRGCLRDWDVPTPPSPAPTPTPTHARACTLMRLSPDPPPLQARCRSGGACATPTCPGSAPRGWPTPLRPACRWALR